MIDVLQDLVEALAQELQRSVAVDDAGLRLLASSTHFEDVDAARLGSLVGRKVSGPPRDYVLQLGVQRWHEPTRLPAFPEVGLDRDRYCFPLRSRYELLGFMWVIDDGTLSSAEIAIAGETAKQIQDVLIRRSQTEDDADVEIEAILLGLLSDERRGRDQAATDLRDLGLFQRATHFAVLVISTDVNPSTVSPEAVRDAVKRGITGTVQGRIRDSVAFSAAAEQSMLLLGQRAAPSDTQLSSLATGLHAEIDRLAPEVARSCWIGVGQAVPQLSDANLSFDQAVLAAAVARDRGQAVSSWANHPLECLLRAWAAPTLREGLIPSQVSRFMQQPAETIEVVEAYLDSGCSVSDTASVLHLHRTTVYYRLNRLEAVTGIDLDDGHTRLLLHLWLKARHISELTE